MLALIVRLEYIGIMFDATSRYKISKLYLSTTSLLRMLLIHSHQFSVKMPLAERPIK
jgi:hypothetical protein